MIADNNLDLDSAITAFRNYRLKTVNKYDLLGPGDPFTITRDEVARTRAVSSRLSNAAGDWFIEKAKTSPWPPSGADLREADPGVRGHLYDEMTACYEHFRKDKPRGVNNAKISKLLHIKRPSVFPILDSEVTACYRLAARNAAQRYPDRGYKKMHWAAIRDDLIANTQSGALAALRDRLSKSPELQIYTQLTDLRLLDILTWRAH